MLSMSAVFTLAKFPTWRIAVATSAMCLLAVATGCPAETPCTLDSDCEGEQVCRSNDAGALTCGAPDTNRVQRVRITDFFASPSPIDAGATTTLTWTSENADGCTITNSLDDSAIEVGANGTEEVTPTAPTDYTLFCSNSEFEATSTASVVVNLPVSITTFAADVTSINLGGSAELNWAAVNAVACTLEGGDEPQAVDATSALVVSPEETTTYSLACTGFPDTVTETVTIDVVSIQDFETTSALVEEGETVTISWNYNGDGACTLEIDGLDVAASGSSYSYLVDAGGVHLAEVSCDGVGAPVTSTLQVIAVAFESLILAPNPVTSGGTVQINWQAVEVDSCVLKRVDGTETDLATGLSSNGSTDLENVTEAQDIQMVCTRTLGATTVTVMSEVVSVTIE